MHIYVYACHIYICQMYVHIYLYMYIYTYIKDLTLLTSVYEIYVVVITSAPGVGWLTQAGCHMISYTETKALR